jgi:hypothetical protein|tara:strand:- start:153 stop:494 length:342 start_codon:yes stop_codon:yes gene_type:complete
MIKKSNHQNQPWSLSDSNYAWDEHKLGRSHKYIARKLGRSEKAVEINISKTRVRLNTTPFTLEQSVGPAVVKHTRKARAKKQVVVEHDQKYWVTFFIGFAGGIFGAVVTAFIL